MARLKSIISKSPTDFFKSKKGDLNAVILSALRKQREEIKDGLMKFTYFQEWNEELKDECAHLAKIKSFTELQTIYGDGVGLNSYTYFLLSGKCCVIEELSISIKYDSFGNKKYSLYRKKPNSKKSSLVVTKNSENLEKNKKRTSWVSDLNVNDENISNCKVTNNKIVTRYLQIYFLQETACFGLGEIGPTRRIVAMNNVKCLLIPRYWLLAHNETNIWSRILQYLKRNIPTTEDVFKAYVSDRKWRKYRKDCVKESLNKTPIKVVTFVPYSIREIDYYESE